MDSEEKKTTYRPKKKHDNSFEHSLSLQIAKYVNIERQLPSTLRKAYPEEKIKGVAM